MRYRCRHLPGPRPSWLVGNVLDFEVGQATEALQKWASSYGPVFVWYLGRKPCIVLSDPDLIRQATILKFPSLHDRSLFPIIPGTAIEADFMRAGLFASKGRAWAHGRGLLQQFFARNELVEHSQKMNIAANKLVAFMTTAASANIEFEAVDTFSRMTLEVIGTTAFGVDFDVQNTDARKLKTAEAVSPVSTTPSSPVFPDLISAATTMFNSAGVRGNTARIALGFSPLLGWLQRRGFALGDRVKVFRRVSLARCYIWGVLHELLNKSLGIISTESKTVASSSKTRKARGDKTMGEISNEKKSNTFLQCPMRRLGNTRATSFTDGKMSLSPLVPESPLLLKLLRNAVDPKTEKPLTDFDICAQSFNMILGAYETTALGMSYTLYELAKQPDLQRRIAEEVAALRALKKQKSALSKPSTSIAKASSVPFDILLDDIKQLPFTEAAFLEGLRIWPPVSPLVPLTRHVNEEVYLNEYRIPKGASLMFNVWDIHHNPKYYTNPGEYTPERFLPNHPEMKSRRPNSFFPFGSGPRRCIGKAFAMTEAVITLAKLIEQFEFRVDMTRSETLNVLTTVTLRPKNGIYLKVFKREQRDK